MNCKRGTTGKINASELFRGWAVGHMQEGVAKTDNVEVKLWHYEGAIDYPKKKFSGTEFIAAFGGVITLQLEENGERLDVDLGEERGDYIILGPAVAKVVVVKKAPAFGVTVRWPSGPGVNKIV